MDETVEGSGEKVGVRPGAQPHTTFISRDYLRSSLLQARLTEIVHELIADLSGFNGSNSQLNKCESHDSLLA